MQFLQQQLFEKMGTYTVYVLEDLGRSISQKSKQGFLTSVSVITGVFTFVALSFYFEACIFNIVFLKYLFLIVHKRKYSTCQLRNNAFIES